MDSIDMTDTDGDGLYDVFETNGMKISNGTIIYSDPSLKDSDGDGIFDFDEMGGLPEEITRYFKENTFSCTLFHGESDPKKKDTDRDGKNDASDSYPAYKDVIKIASLTNDDFLPVYDSINLKEKHYGGSQGWWKSYDEKIVNEGCGLIAMANLETYLLNGNVFFDPIINGCLKSSYMKYCESRKTDYPIYNIVGVAPDKYHIFRKNMTTGFYNFAKCNSDYSDFEAQWEPSDDPSIITEYIKEMLNSDIPVVASYFDLGAELTDSGSTGQIIDIFADGLDYYTYMPNGYSITDGEGEFSSHYFTITGIYKVRVKVYGHYYFETIFEISSWGKKYYIKKDKWESKLSFATNILSIDH